VDYSPVDCYEKIDPADEAARVHPAYQDLLKEYPFQQVTNQRGQQVNIILVRSSWQRRKHQELYEKYKNDILFMGISSFEDYPLDAHNPWSPRLNYKDYVGIFPGFLHMMHHPENFFPPEVKTILMSQSDFQLPAGEPRDYSAPKKYDFTYAQSAPDVASDCVGWGGYCKNWSFVKQSLEVMCGEYNMTGVLVATADEKLKNADGTMKKCSIPKVCDGKIVQTAFLKNQFDYFHYLQQSRFAYVPQVHDASPRISTQALVYDVPIFMNKHISGGWKYINEDTGEFFHDMSDFRKQMEKIVRRADQRPGQGGYNPRDWVLKNYGNKHSGKRLFDFVNDNFVPSHVVLPKGTTSLWT